MHGVEHHASAGRSLHYEILLATHGHLRESDLAALAQMSLSGAFRSVQGWISNTDMISMPEDRSAQAKVTYQFAVGCSPPTTLASPCA
jgi:hypothetical protein